MSQKQVTVLHFSPSYAANSPYNVAPLLVADNNA